jgi:hypothetical protein
LPDVITSMPYPKRTSAMSPVMPNPAAEFSPLAMTKSIWCRSIRAGRPRRTISRPGLPKMSPMKRIFIS